MAAGDTTISGGSYLRSDTVGIAAFVETVITATVSGAQVFTYADGPQKIFVGVTEGASAS